MCIDGCCQQTAVACGTCVKKHAHHHAFFLRTPVGTRRWVCPESQSSYLATNPCPILHKKLDTARGPCCRARPTTMTGAAPSAGLCAAPRWLRRGPQTSLAPSVVVPRCGAGSRCRHTPPPAPGLGSSHHSRGDEVRHHAHPPTPAVPRRAVAPAPTHELRSWTARPLAPVCAPLGCRTGRAAPSRLLRKVSAAPTFLISHSVQWRGCDGARCPSRSAACGTGRAAVPRKRAKPRFFREPVHTAVSRTGRNSRRSAANA